MNKCKSDCVNCPPELYKKCNFGKRYEYLVSIGLEKPNKAIIKENKENGI